MTWSTPEKRREYARVYYARNRDRFREYRARLNPEDVRAYMRSYFETHREEFKIYGARYRASHREKIRSYNLRYAQEHREENRSRLRAWKNAYPDRHRAAIKSWREAHPETTRLYSRTRRMKKAGNGGSHTIQQWLELCQAHDWRCFYCGKRATKLEEDHVLPVSRGGTDDIINIVPACRSCNARKHSKTANEFKSLTT